MFNIFSAKNNKDIELFHAYNAGVRHDKEIEDEERYEHEKNNVDFYDEYIARINAGKFVKEKEAEDKYREDEDKNIKLCMYRTNKDIIDIWKSIEEEISNAISRGIAYGPPKKIYVEFKSENNNVTAVVTRYDPNSFTNAREILYTSNSYEIPGDFDEEIVVRVLTEFCDEDLYGKKLDCIL